MKIINFMKTTDNDIEHELQINNLKKQFQSCNIN